MEILLLAFTQFVAAFVVSLAAYSVLMANIGLLIVIFYCGYREYKKRREVSAPLSIL